jgi:hypothetical protein
MDLRKAWKNKALEKLNKVSNKAPLMYKGAFLHKPQYIGFFYNPKLG